MSKEIEKAHNVGEQHPTKPYVWTEYKPGKFDWRPIKGQTVPKPAAASAATKQEPAKEEPAAEKKQEETPKSQPKPYDAPKPTVDYSVKPEIEYQVPESWEATDKSGKRMTQTRAELRKKFGDTTKFTDDKLIAIVNAVHMNNPNVRHIAWEEAAHRGIPESKLNVSGSLKNAWENYAERYKLTHKNAGQSEEEEDYGSAYNSAIGNFDVESFKAEFPDGDDGWSNPNDPRVKKAFHNLVSLKDRQQWDAVVDQLKREDPLYEGVDDQLNSLRIQFDAFLESDPKNHSAMFVSSGGAGAGKTYALEQMIKANGMSMFDPEDPKYSDPTAPNIDVVEMESDIDDEKDFFNVLRKYNGKIIIFDDKDKALVSNATKLKSAMKNIADGNYKKRLIPGANGKPELFTGKLIFITNKSFTDLISDEDHKAIFSRADKNDIHFTLNENLEVLGKRYKEMGGRMEGFTKQEEDDFRQKVYDTIIDNVDKIDPMKFTVRKFSEMLREVAAVKKASKKSEESAEFEALFGGKGSSSLKWRNQIIKMLNKAEENEIEKSHSQEVFDNLSDDAIAAFKRKLAKDPDKFKELFGEKLVKFLKTKKDVKESEEVSKADVEDMCKGMSVEEAENILLG